MRDDIEAMSGELARHPSSLVFLELGEALRRRGQLDAAAQVVRGGLDQHAGLAEASDLYARILVDQGHFEQARDVWEALLEREPRHGGAHRGLGFLWFRWDDLDRALDHLEVALAGDPTNESVLRAMRTVRNALDERDAAAEGAREDPVFAGLEGAERGLLLVDDRGRVLGGGLRRAGRGELSEEVAAYLAGAAHEAERTSRILGLGTWQWIVSEGSEGNVYVTQPTPSALLLIVRDRSVPAGRLALLAERAGDIARVWLAEQQL